MLHIIVVCFILTKHVLSIQALFINCYVYVILDSQGAV